MRRSFYVPDSIVVILAKLVLLNIALVVTISGLYAGVLLFAAFFTLLERKFMGLWQRREGPDRVGLEGLGQPFADAFKLIRKRRTQPRRKKVFVLSVNATIFSLGLAMPLWLFLPASFREPFVHSEQSLIFFLALATLGTYGTIFAGWSSQRKYALLGAFRAVAQLLGYELLLTLALLPLVSKTGRVDLSEISTVLGMVKTPAYQPMLVYVLVVLFLAETQRTPYDLAEAEAELVAGYHVEYSSMFFSCFMLREYANMGFYRVLLWLFALPYVSRESILFCSTPLIEKGFFIVHTSRHVFWENGIIYALMQGFGVTFFCSIFIFSRVALPRGRFDYLLRGCWVLGFPAILGEATLHFSILCLF